MLCLALHVPLTCIQVKLCFDSKSRESKIIHCLTRGAENPVRVLTIDWVEQMNLAEEQRF